MKGERQRLIGPISAYTCAGDLAEEGEMLTQGLQLDALTNQMSLEEPAGSPLNTLSHQKGEPKSRNKCPLKCPPLRGVPRGN